MAGRKLESRFQKNLIKKLRMMFPGCLIQKLDPSYQQGIPDLLILFEDRWAILEVKRGRDEAEHPEPNQRWFVAKLNEMSFSAFIYPENEEEVLNDLQSALRPRRQTRVSQRQ